jgi:glycosyltransferase involved in cell wall biosynthesis
MTDLGQIPIRGSVVPPVSVVVLTYMEELNIENCLRSVAGWSTDIHVLDSGSTDRTVEIAQRYAHHVHFHAYVDHASQVAYVISELPLRFEWLLLLDADNEVSEELKRSIDEVLGGADQGNDGFYSRHRHVFRGGEVRGLKRWWLRLFRHRNAEVDESELVDWRLRLRGPTGFLRGEITEHNLKEDDLDFWIDKHQKFASRMAAEETLRRSGVIGWSIQPRLSGNPDERMAWLKDRWYSCPLYVRPFLYFGYRYFWRMGFLDGWNGLLFHFLQAFWFRLLVDIRVSDLEHQIAAGKLRLQDLAAGHGREFGPLRRAGSPPGP